MALLTRSTYALRDIHLEWQRCTPNRILLRKSDNFSRLRTTLDSSWSTDNRILYSSRIDHLLYITAGRKPVGELSVQLLSKQKIVRPQVVNDSSSWLGQCLDSATNWIDNLRELRRIEASFLDDYKRPKDRSAHVIERLTAIIALIKRDHQWLVMHA
jgi:hypothetical protein